MIERYASKFKVPKTRIIEQALRVYFEKLKKAEYSASFRKAANDDEMVSMAEQGFEDYLKILGEK